MPTGWEAPDGFWKTDNAPLNGMTGNYFTVSSQTSSITEARLISPAIDCSKYATVFLSFDQNFNAKSGGNTEKVQVDISNDGGLTWNPISNTPVLEMSENTGNAVGKVRMDISHYASGQFQVKVRWRYFDANSDGFWAIDNIRIENGNRVSLP